MLTPEDLKAEVVAIKTLMEIAEDKEVDRIQRIEASVAILSHLVDKHRYK